MTTTVSAKPSDYQVAADHLAGAGSDAPAAPVPDLGHAGAEAAMHRFTAAMADFHGRLGQAATGGAASARRLATNLDRAGNQ